MEGGYTTPSRKGQASRRVALGWLAGAALLSACTSDGDAGRGGGTTDRIARGRREIDELDDRIIELIRRRIEASHQVQHARTASGGQRTDPRREQEIVAHYRGGLGAGGPEIAQAILDAARGQPT